MLGFLHKPTLHTPARRRLQPLTAFTHPWVIARHLQRYRLHGLRRARPSVPETGADTPSENAPEAFLGMLDGKNFAEFLIRVS
jgi:hypothetical protein